MRAGSADKTLRIHEGLYHDLLREPDGAGEQVTGEVLAWLEAHSGGPAVSFTSSQPAGPLKGDGHGHLLAVELDARGEQAREGDVTGITGGLRLRAGLGRGDAGLGYLGGLDVRAGSLDGGIYEVDAHLLGLALRGPGGAQLSLTGGIGVGGPRGNGATRAPIELAMELPAGPVHLVARGALAWRIRGDRYMDDALGLADDASALLGLRLGRDRRYWGSVAAGSGPLLALTYRSFGGAEFLGVSLGVQLWGGN
jgi:hypothetical protein